MVNIQDVYDSNESLKHGGSGLVAVVIGGTSGIGRAFVKQLAANTDSPKIYLLGRSQSGLETQVKELQSLNSEGTYIPVLADDLTLIRNVDAATTTLKTLLSRNDSSKIDLLFLSAGYVSLGSRNPTPIEDIDAVTSIRYYARMRFLSLLLPNLLMAPSPRVLSVLGGGLEGPIFPDDLSFRDPKNYSIGGVAGATGTYTTLFLEHLHSTLAPDQKSKISFIHLFPGLVAGTNLLDNPSIRSSSFFAGPLLSFLNWVVLPLLKPFLLTPVDQVGARMLYVITNGKFRSVPELATTDNATGIATGSDGKVGSGVYTVNEKTEPVQTAEKVLTPLREKGWPEKIYEHTVREWERALAAYDD